MHMLYFTQQKPCKFQSAPERSGASERVEPPSAIPNAHEHVTWSHELSRVCDVV